QQASLKERTNLGDVIGCRMQITQCYSLIMNDAKRSPPSVMPVSGLDRGIVAGIHVFPPPYPPRLRGRVGRGSKQDLDGRDKPGQDSEQMVQHGARQMIRSHRNTL